MTYSKAKAQIKTLFKKANGPLCYADIGRELQLDLELVVSICTQLEEEGYIGELGEISHEEIEEEGP